MARPKKHKISDDDDEPTYVDENSQNAISKADYDALMNPQKLEKEEERSANSPPTSQNRQLREDATSSNDHLDQEVLPSRLEASIGGISKKRLAKIIGEDGKSAQSSPNENPSVIESGGISKLNKKEKKAKKVKLSFDEDDGK